VQSSPSDWLGELCLGGGEASSTPSTPCTPVVSETRALPQRRRSHSVPCALLLSLCVLSFSMLCGGLWRGVRRMAREERSQDEAFGKQPGGVEVQVQPRTYLLDGSLYQNQYMTLWNANNMPVSVELRVLPKDHFELIVDHLDSQGGGDGAWMKIRGTFHTEPISGVSGTSGRLRLVPSLPSEAEGGEGFSYDESVLTSSTAFAFRCLKRWGASSLISALQLELDIAEESVIVTPRSSIIRMLWDESVALRRTTEEKMWNSGARQRPSN